MRVLLVIALLTGATGVAALLRPEGEPAQRWLDGSAHGAWLAVFDGEGSTTFREGAISLSPRAATRPDETHAGLVVSMRHYQSIDYAVSMRTTRQLRKPEPQPWEAGWVVWQYEGNDRFYYFSVKRNGWELGKVDPAYPGGQRFLATGDEPLGFQGERRVRVRQIDNVMSVWVDGRPVVTFTDNERPYLRGAIGMYSEDAVVRFSDVAVRPAVAG